MTIDYQLEPADFVVLSEEHRRRFASDSLSRLYYYGILPALGVALALVTQSFPIAIIFTLLFIAAGWFIHVQMQRAHQRILCSDENASFSLRRWTVTLADEGLRVSSDAADVIYRWPFIRQIFRGTRFVHIQLTPLQKVHIPIRAFRDEAHLQQFITAAQSHIKTPASK